MDFYPESLNILTTPSAGFTIPYAFYGKTLEHPQNKIFIDIDDPRYNLYVNRIYRLMKRDQNPDVSYTLNTKNVFD